MSIIKRKENVKVSEKIRIFIGCGPRFEEPTNALICSIYENCSDPERLDIQLMEAWAEPEWSNWHGQPTEENFGRVKGNWVTPFSLFRYAIPEVCGYEGYAIYLDADMIVLGDICDLWNHRVEGRWVSAPGPDGDCVTVLDCTVDLFPLIPLVGGKLGNKHRLRDMIAPYVRRILSQEWNHTDKYVPSVSKLIHYTSMKTQPFKPYPEVLDYLEHPDQNARGIYYKYVERSLEWQIRSNG